MRLVLLAAFLATGAAAQAPVLCTDDASCAKLGAGYQCMTQKTACAVHPESSTCAVRACWRKPGGAIKDEDRACKKDSDCETVLLEFRCMYCARPGDFESGLVGAANKKHVFEYVVKPHKEQLRHCAMAGPCAQTGTVRPRCRKSLCAAEYVPREEAPH